MENVFDLVKKPKPQLEIEANVESAYILQEHRLRKLVDKLRDEAEDFPHVKIKLKIKM